MKPSMWTGIFFKLPLASAIERLSLSGWRAFDVSTEHLDMIMNAPAPEREIEAAREVAKRLGLALEMSHPHLMADVASPDLAKREEDMRLLLKHFEISAKLGVSHVTVHPGGGAGLATRAERRATVAANVESFKRLCDVAGSLGLRVGAENLFDERKIPGLRRYGSLPSDLLDLADAVGSPALGFTFDSSHANVQRLDLPAAIRELGSLIVCTHMSDNDGSGDQHKAPASGKGSIDWKGVVEALKSVGYDGVFNLEIPGERAADDETSERNSAAALKAVEKLLKSV